jgi:5-methylcytosine-specific restriction protein A
MPRRPPHPCPEPGCPALVQGRGRCPAHQRERDQRIDERRGSSTARGYGYAWQQLRLHMLRDEPLCRMCKAEGRVTAATEVDHVDGNSRNNARENLRPLCKSCHSRRTATDQAFGRRHR